MDRRTIGSLPRSPPAPPFQYPSARTTNAPRDLRRKKPSRTLPPAEHELSCAAISEASREGFRFGTRPDEGGSLMTSPVGFRLLLRQRRIAARFATTNRSRAAIDFPDPVRSNEWTGTIEVDGCFHRQPPCPSRASAREYATTLRIGRNATTDSDGLLFSFLFLSQNIQVFHDERKLDVEEFPMGDETVLRGGARAQARR